jgi:hypothetical protein
LLEFLVECIELEYAEPHTDFIPYDKEEYAFLDQGESLSYILYDQGVSCSNQALLDLLDDLSGPARYASHYSFIPSYSEHLSEKWIEFTEKVSKYDPLEILKWSSQKIEREFELASIVRYAINEKIVSFVKKNINLYRIRPMESQFELTAPSLGTPPKTYQPTRFFPAGSPAFYAAFDLKTALIETYNPDVLSYAVGRWKSRNDVKVVNLAAIPKVPSLFDNSQNRYRDQIRFMNEFASEISKPVLTGDASNYVATQLFFRVLVGTWESIHGLVYWSSKYRRSKCCVLMHQNNQCIERRAKAFHSLPVLVLHEKFKLEIPSREAIEKVQC